MCTRAAALRKTLGLVPSPCRRSTRRDSVTAATCVLAVVSSPVIIPRRRGDGTQPVALAVPWLVSGWSRLVGGRMDLAVATGPPVGRCARLERTPKTGSLCCHGAPLLSGGGGTVVLGGRGWDGDAATPASAATLPTRGVRSSHSRHRRAHHRPRRRRSADDRGGGEFPPAKRGACAHAMPGGAAAASHCQACFPTRAVGETVVVGGWGRAAERGVFRARQAGSKQPPYPPLGTPTGPPPPPHSW